MPIHIGTNDIGIMESYLLLAGWTRWQGDGDLKEPYSIWWVRGDPLDARSRWMRMDEAYFMEINATQN